MRTTVEKTKICWKCQEVIRFLVTPNTMSVNCPKCAALIFSKTPEATVEIGSGDIRGVDDLMGQDGLFRPVKITDKQREDSRRLLDF